VEKTEMTFDRIAVYAFSPKGEFRPDLSPPLRIGGTETIAPQPQYYSPGEKVDALARELLNAAGPTSPFNYQQAVDHILAHNPSLREDFGRWGY
jgi:hypothetical protein